MANKGEMGYDTTEWWRIDFILSSVKALLTSYAKCVTQLAQQINLRYIYCRCRSCARQACALY